MALIPSPPMTNAERQRLFQRNNPGYDARRKRAQRASEKAATKQFILQAQATAAEQTAEVRREPLLLPAPVEPIVFPTLAELREQREAVPVGR